MKKLILIITLAFSTISLAQDLSYGVVLGSNEHKINAKRPLYGTGSYSYFNFGVFVDYNINEKFGLKTQLLFNKVKEDFYTHIEQVEFDTYVSSLHFSTNFKYDVDHNYGKGFYLLSGPRLSFVLDSEYDNGEKLDGFYKSMNFGVQLGFGVIVLKHFGLELVGDFDISNNLEGDLESRNIGAYVNLNINLESLINN